MPPRKIKNKIYANQNVEERWPTIRHVNRVWMIMFKVIDKGWFSCIKINEDMIMKLIISIVISESSLIKILILGIKDKVYFFSEVLKNFILILIYKTNVLI